MARYGLFALKVPLNPNQPTNLSHDLSTSCAAALLDKIQCSAHCVNVFLLPKKATDYEPPFLFGRIYTIPYHTTDYVLRNRESSYILRHCELENFKRSFVNWCLLICQLSSVLFIMHISCVNYNGQMLQHVGPFCPAHILYYCIYWSVKTSK